MKLKLIVFALIALYTLLIVYDLAAPYYITDYNIPVHERCDRRVTIIDVYSELDDLNTSYCLLHGLSLDELRSLGSINSSVIFIVTHAFGEGKSIAIGTSDRNVFRVVIMHPITSIIGLSTGVLSNGSKFIAADWRALMISRSLSNKTIVIVSCGGSSLVWIAREMIKHGASTVICACWSKMPCSMAREIVKQLIRAYRVSGVKGLVAMARTWGFKVITSRR